MIAAALPFVLFGFVAPALSQTADELIAKNLAARGGVDRLAAIHSVVSRGELRFPGDFKLAFKETKTRTGGSANAARVEATIEGLTVIQAFDGTSAWRVNPFEGRKDAERMGADETRELADARVLLQAALAHCLEGRELATRAVARSMARRGS